jgi:hypothetical protein
MAPAERCAAEQLDQPRHRGDERADLDDKHHRVADLHARIELGQRAGDGRSDDLAAEQG